jgi:hypothetical protein
MPPRRSARLAAATAPPDAALSPLPLPLVLHIFSLLTADERARAACVCRGWRVTLDEVSLWTRLDLSPSSGVTCEVTDAVLAGAAAKARGQLAALDVSGCRVGVEMLAAVVRVYGARLRELSADVFMLFETTDEVSDTIQRLLLSAPHVAAVSLRLDARVSTLDAARMLRGEPPFERLRLRGLSVQLDPLADEALVLGLAADIAAHATLRHLQLTAMMLTPVALDALVDAVLARRLLSLSFVHAVGVSPEVVPPLARMLRDGTALTDLHLHAATDGQGAEAEVQQLLDGPSAALLGAALRGNSTLASLSLVGIGLWRDPHAAAVLLLGGLMSHRSVRTLGVPYNRAAPRHEAAAGAVLGALVGANAPALRKLCVVGGELGDAAMRPLFEALAGNTHLRTLDAAHNRASFACTTDALLPAVRANASLRKLCVSSLMDEGGAPEAEALVRARPPVVDEA